MKNTNERLVLVLNVITDLPITGSLTIWLAIAILRKVLGIDALSTVYKTIGYGPGGYDIRELSIEIQRDLVDERIYQLLMTVIVFNEMFRSETKAGFYNSNVIKRPFREIWSALGEDYIKIALPSIGHEYVKECLNCFFKPDNTLLEGPTSGNSFNGVFITAMDGGYGKIFNNNFNKLTQLSKNRYYRVTYSDISNLSYLLDICDNFMKQVINRYYGILLADQMFINEATYLLDSKLVILPRGCDYKEYLFGRHDFSDIVKLIANRTKLVAYPSKPHDIDKPKNLGYRLNYITVHNSIGDIDKHEKKWSVLQSKLSLFRYARLINRGTFFIDYNRDKLIEFSKFLLSTLG